jgi:hypothetical protein
VGLECPTESGQISFALNRQGGRLGVLGTDLHIDSDIRDILDGEGKELCGAFCVDVRRLSGDSG